MTLADHIVRIGFRASKMNLTLQEAKERVRIPELWREFGYEGEPGKNCFWPISREHPHAGLLYLRCREKVDVSRGMWRRQCR